MCIRSVAVDDGSGPVLQGELESSDWSRRGQLIAVFNPKGGVGKTMLATNLAGDRWSTRATASCSSTPTPSPATSASRSGMDGVPTVVDAWRDELDGGPVVPFFDLASAHPSGPAGPAALVQPDPDRDPGPGPGREARIAVARRSVDFVIVDLHPSYSPLNRAVFDKTDRILVPVTPDLPAIRAVMKLRDVADELGMRDRLSLIVNRANSGVPTEDIEKAVGIAGLRPDPVGRPRDRQGRQRGPHARGARAHGTRSPTTSTILADRLLGLDAPQPAKAGFKLFGRTMAART